MNNGNEKYGAELAPYFCSVTIEEFGNTISRGLSRILRAF